MKKIIGLVFCVMLLFVNPATALVSEIEIEEKEKDETLISALNIKINGNISDLCPNLLSGDRRLIKTWMPVLGMTGIVCDRQGDDCSVCVKIYKNGTYTNISAKQADGPGEIKGIYFGRDKDRNAIILVLTTVPLKNLGDLAINTDGDKSDYEVGVMLNSKHKEPFGTLCCDVDEWDWLPGNADPTVIVECSKMATIEIAYNHSAYKERYGGHGYEVDVGAIKMKIPPDLVPIINSIKIEIVPCQNDELELDVGEIPEFSTIAIPIAAILGLLFFFNRRKHRKE